MKKDAVMWEQRGLPWDVFAGRAWGATSAGQKCARSACPGWSAHPHGSLHLKDMYLGIYTCLVLHRHHPRKGSELDEPQSRSNLAIPMCLLLTSHYWRTCSVRRKASSG